jgi:hypothetical protein
MSTMLSEGGSCNVAPTAAPGQVNSFVAAVLLDTAQEQTSSAVRETRWHQNIETVRIEGIIDVEAAPDASMMMHFGSQVEGVHPPIVTAAHILRATIIFYAPPVTKSVSEVR